MDTSEVAGKLGTTPRILRQFLRSSVSTFVAVGSGSRYEFTDSDLPTLQRRFTEWRSGGKKRPKSKVVSTPRPVPAVTAETPSGYQPTSQDMAVWREEGPVTIPDIRNPRVRARVKADAKKAEDQLMMLLMSKGLHISQLGDRKAS